MQFLILPPWVIKRNFKKLLHDFLNMTLSFCGYSVIPEKIYIKTVPTSKRHIKSFTKYWIKASNIG